MWFAPSWPFAADLFAAYTHVPHWISLVGALFAGAAAGYFGWYAAPGVRKRSAPADAVPQA